MAEKTTKQLAQEHTITTDRELSNVITMDYFSRWCRSLATQEGKAEADRNKNYFCGLFPAAKPNSPAAMNYTAFAGGLEAGMELAEKLENLEGAATNNPETPPQIRTAIKKTLEKIDNQRHLLALLSMAQELAKPDNEPEHKTPEQ